MKSILGEHKEVWWYVPGLNQLPFDPANNNEPLQFGSASGPLVTEGLIENGGESSKKRKRTNAPSADKSRTLNVDSTAMTLPMSDPTAWATAMNNLGMTPLGIAGQPILPDFDPALGMMTGIPPITPMMPGLGIVPPPIPPDMPVVKEIIHCKSCTLFPPNPSNILLFLHTSHNVLVSRNTFFSKRKSKGFIDVCKEVSPRKQKTGKFSLTRQN